MPAYSGLWNGVFNENHSLLINKSATFRKIARELRRKASVKLREVIDTVADGSSINGAAAVTHKQVAADVNPGQVAGGGARTIETITDIAAAAVVGTNTPTAAQIDGLVDHKSYPATYPTDASGNGGGGRLDGQYAVNG